MARKHHHVPDLIDQQALTPTGKPAIHHPPPEDAEGPAVELEEAGAAAPPVEPVVPPPPPPSTANVKRLPHFKVLKDKQASWRGQPITLRAGDVVSEESYGPMAIERLRDAGVELEEVPPPV